MYTFAHTYIHHSDRGAGGGRYHADGGRYHAGGGRYHALSQGSYSSSSACGLPAQTCSYSMLY